VTRTLESVPASVVTSNGMRIRTKVKREGGRSSVALNDIATRLGFDFIWKMEKRNSKLETRNWEKKIPRFDPDLAASLLLKKGQDQARACPPARAHAQNQRARHFSHGADA